MKIPILTLLFCIGSGFGGAMVVFGNPFGDYVILAAVGIGLYVMSQDKDSGFSQEGEYEQMEPRKYSKGSN